MMLINYIYLMISSIFNQKSTPKNQKLRNATKTQRHKISQNNECQSNNFGGILSFSALVARKRLFGVDSINNYFYRIIIKLVRYFEQFPQF